MIRRISHLSLLLCASGALAAAPDDFSLPTPQEAGAAKLNLWGTYYYVQPVNEVAAGIPLRAKNGAALTGNISPRDWCAGAIEGTVQVLSGGKLRTLNYGGTGIASQVDCAATLKIDPAKKPWITSTGKSYFSEAKGPFGDGVNGLALVPYRTIAVDAALIPVRTVVYIPAAKGMEVTIAPGQSFRHDGYFFAADKGGAIKGNHVDFFCGNHRGNCFPAFVASDDKKAFEAWIVKDEAVRAKLAAIHTP